METDKINFRIAQILKHYELSASAFADSIQVQRSSISHILKGRNKPSLEFVTKLLRIYPEIDLYWLLCGQGVFLKEISTGTPLKRVSRTKATIPSREKKVEKVLLFYTDGTFSSYKPEP